MKYIKSEDVVYRKVAGESILVPIKGNVADMQKLFALEGVGEFVWQNIDRTRGAVDIASLVADEFDVGLQTALKDVSQFVEKLLENELILPVAAE